MIMLKCATGYHRKRHHDKRSQCCFHGRGAAVYRCYQLHFWDDHLNLCLHCFAPFPAALLSANLGEA